MNRLTSRTLAGLLTVGAQGCVAPAPESLAAVGCYAPTGSWPAGHPATPAWVVLDTFQFRAANDSGGQRRIAYLETLVPYAATGIWRPVGRDSLALEWPDVTGEVRARLRRTPNGWAGSAEALSDWGRHHPAWPVELHRAPCPPWVDERENAAMLQKGSPREARTLLP